MIQCCLTLRNECKTQEMCVCYCKVYMQVNFFSLYWDVLSVTIRIIFCLILYIKIMCGLNFFSNNCQTMYISYLCTRYYILYCLWFCKNIVYCVSCLWNTCMMYKYMYLNKESKIRKIKFVCSIHLHRKTCVRPHQ